MLEALGPPEDLTPVLDFPESCKNKNSGDSSTISKHLLSTYCVMPHTRISASHVCHINLVPVSSGHELRASLSSSLSP